jgi:hypothetical protein
MEECMLEEIGMSKELVDKIGIPPTILEQKIRNFSNKTLVAEEYLSLFLNSLFLDSEVDLGENDNE